MEFECSAAAQSGEDANRARVVEIGLAGEKNEAQEARPLVDSFADETPPTFEQNIAAIASSRAYAIDLTKRQEVKAYCDRIAAGDLGATGRLGESGPRQTIDPIEWPGRNGLAAQLLYRAGYAALAEGEPAYTDVRIEVATDRASISDGTDAAQLALDQYEAGANSKSNPINRTTGNKRGPVGYDDHNHLKEMVGMLNAGNARSVLGAAWAVVEADHVGGASQQAAVDRLRSKFRKFCVKMDGKYELISGDPSRS